MSEEENKAIWYFGEVLTYEFDYEQWKIIENLLDRLQIQVEESEKALVREREFKNKEIDRLQKELEQEKEKNKKLIAGKFREIADKNSYIKDMYVSKDKIKEQIKVFKKEGSQTSLIIASVLEDLLKKED